MVLSKSFPTLHCLSIVLANVVLVVVQIKFLLMFKPILADYVDALCFCAVHTGFS